MPPPYQDSYGSGGGQVRFALPSLTPAVKKIVIANFAVFVGLFLLGIGSRQTEGTLMHWLGLDPVRWRQHLPFVPLWQLVTYGFLHGGWWHLFWNMLQLYFFGTVVEQRVGARRFVVFYLAAVLLGGAVQLTASLVTGDAAYTIGASGGALGVVVAAAVINPDMLVILIFIPVKLKWLAVGLVGIDVFAILNTLKNPELRDNVARWAHIGGAVWGLLAARRGWMLIDPFERWNAQRAQAQQAARVSDEERMDELLAKISREGMSALTKRERELLKRISNRR